MRRKQLHEAEFPETKAGQSQALGMNKALGKDVAAESAATFAKDAAEKTGKSERTIRADVQIANVLLQFYYSFTTTKHTSRVSKHRSETLQIIRFVSESLNKLV